MQLRLGGLAVAQGDAEAARRWFAGAKEAGILQLRNDLSGQLELLEKRLEGLESHG
jgi:hypothetical protein